MFTPSWMPGPTWPSRPTAGGSGSWRKTDWQPLAGKDVSIWADADDDAPGCTKPNGRLRAESLRSHLASHLHKLGCRVRVAIPEPDGGADIADWLAVGKSHAKRKLAGLLRDYKPELQPEPEPEPEPEDDPPYFGARLRQIPTLR